MPRRTTGAIALGAALLVAPLGSAQDNAEEEVFELSPFTVDASQDSGYRATTTLAGTRIRTDLRDVGSAISVVTEQFLRDTNATDNESLLIYTTNTEVGGARGNFAGGGDSSRVDTDSQRLAPNAATRVRGLAAADNLRDYFVTDIPWDSYNVDRIDLQRGANSVLFGLGSAAGVINASVHQANFGEDKGRFEARFGSFGSWRASLNYNKVLIEDQLAVRVAALKEDEEFRQKGAFEKDERFFVALNWQPKIFATESSNTQIRANFETGEIDANRPRVIPPIDRITPWFTDMNKATYDSQTIDDVGGPLDRGGAQFQPWLGATVGRVFDGPVAVFNGGGTPSSFFMAQLPDGRIRGIDGFDGYAKTANLPNSQIGVYKSKTLNDPTIFDFYNNLIDGPNKSEWQDWNAYNVSFAHNMMDNRLGFEFSYDKQQYEEGQTNILDNAGQAISVDIMATLPDGSPNPNVGRPLVGGDAQNNSRNISDRNTFRATAYYNIDFSDIMSDSLGGILGTHSFTAVYSKQDQERRRASWIRNTAVNINSGSAITQANRYVASMAYIGPSLMGANSASGANLQRLTQPLVMADGTIITQAAEGDPFVSGPISVWSADNGDIDNLYRQGSFADDSIDSKVFVWQGKLLDGMVVPLFGYREDTATARNAGDVPNHPTISGARMPYDRSWNLPVDMGDTGQPNSSYNVASGINRTYGLVVHTPQSIRDRLPGGMNVSLLYSDSSNFKPDASRKDLLGNSVPPSTGETKEYGVVVSAMEDRFYLKVNKYKTIVRNDTLSASSIANSYMIGAGEGWGYMFGLWADAGLHEFSRNFAHEDPEDPTTPLINPDIPVLRYQPVLTDTMSPAERAAAVAATYAEEQAALAATLDPANWPSQAFRDFWAQNWEAITAEGGWDHGGDAWNGEPSQFAITGDSISEGWEYELFFQPTNNWNIMFNASKTEARRTNLAESYASFVEERWALYQGPYGDVRLWGPGAGGETRGSKYAAEFYSNYTLFNLLNDSNVPELRPWRFNLITNYNFSDGAFKGFSVGGALRWQDEVVVGYPVIQGVDGPTLDINNPYKGGDETDVDLWVGYTRQLNDNLDWRVQLNVANAFSSKGLIPVTVQPDGSPATSRIAPSRVITLTNSFNF